MLVAGEASGDEHAARLIRRLRETGDCECFGMGGAAMRDAGARLLVDSTALAVVGIVEVIRYYPALRRAFRTLVRALRRERPALLVLVDYPEFNLRLARVASRLGVPVLFYIAPQAWAWRRGRVKKIRRRVSRLAVILPFERAFFEQHGIAADYVGHPLVEDVARWESANDAPPSPARSRKSKTVLLLPGSRRGEVERLLPAFCGAAERLTRRLGGLVAFRVLRAPGIGDEMIAPLLKQDRFDCRLADGGTYAEMRRADAAISATGTAILQLALCGTPAVGVYKLSPPTYFLARRLVKVPHASLVNIIGGKAIIPELLQEAATPQAICGETYNLLTNESRRRDVLQGYGEVRRKLGERRASERLAEIVREMIEATKR